MPVTTTPRKRQLHEEQDTDSDQSTSAKEAKISKPEIQKVQASVPLNDVISSLEDQIRFTDVVIKKQQLLLEQELSPEVRKNVQEILEMHEKRNSRLKRELQDMKVQFGVVADNEDLQQKKIQMEDEKPKPKLAPATTTSRKRQLNEAQDTDQSSSATEAKISKPVVQKEPANVPQNDVISLLVNQIRFNDNIMKKLRLIERKVSPDIGKDLLETLDIIQKRNSQLKGEEKPKTTNRLKSLLFELQCQIFEDLSDNDLFSLMMSDSSYEEAAGDVLRRRKISLSYLDIDYGTETVLEVKTGSGTTSERYKLNVENAAALCEGYEEKKGNNLTRAIHLLFTYYNCSAADVIGAKRCFPDEIPLTMEAFFGPAPNEPGEKIKIGRLNIETTLNEVIFLRWFCPKHLEVWYSPPWLIQASQEELKQLVVGIDEIELSGVVLDLGMADKLMEACDATDITIEDDRCWSYNSIFSVVQANLNCDNKGATRTIKMDTSYRSKHPWKDLFAVFMKPCEENPEEDVNYTIRMPKCDFEVHRCFVKLFLY